MIKYKICDRKAPRYRPSKYRHNLLCKELWEEYCEKTGSKVSWEDFKTIFISISKKVIDLSTTEREGCILPGYLGKMNLVLFKVVEKPIHENLARNHGMDAKHMMIDTDGLQGKIQWKVNKVRYAPNYLMRYGFNAHRDFKKLASHLFKTQSEKYTTFDLTGAERRRAIKNILKDEQNLARSLESSQEPGKSS